MKVLSLLLRNMQSHHHARLLDSLNESPELIAQESASTRRHRARFERCLNESPELIAQE